MSAPPRSLPMNLVRHKWRRGYSPRPIAVLPFASNDPQPRITRTGVSDAASCDAIQETISAPGLKILSHEPVDDPSLFDCLQQVKRFHCQIVKRESSGSSTRDRSSPARCAFPIPPWESRVQLYLQPDQERLLETYAGKVLASAWNNPIRWGGEVSAVIMKIREPVGLNLK